MKRRWLYVGFILIVLMVAALWPGLAVRHYQVQDERIDAPVRLAVLTDLHGTRYGQDQSELVEEIEAQSPDAVVIVGDMIDRTGSAEDVRSLVEALSSRWPGYYVSGNHEYLSGQAEALKKLLEDAGIVVLEGEGAQLGSSNILLCGVDDPVFGRARWQQQLVSCREEASLENFSVLLTHRPERVDEYGAFDLILSGHAHGGQVRVPGLVNGLYAPNQGIFPEYAGGWYDLGINEMIVSRGLVRNALPRVFNPPELVIVDLLPKE